MIRISILGTAIILATTNAWAHGENHKARVSENWESSPRSPVKHEEIGEGLLEAREFLSAMACREATQRQIAEIDAGNELREEFLRQCDEETEGSPWCEQLVRPNPSSISTFRCTYGQRQPHQLIHPNRSTWTYAFQAVNLIEDLEELGIRTCQIYNWWRPEPYNGNVGGAAGRHPFATSVDVRFCSINDMERAFAQLCRYRRQGRLRALGYYGSTGLHFGVGDRTANTWGKSCN